MMLKQTNKIAIIIVSLYTIIQIVCLHIFGYTPYPDSNVYITLAKECIEFNTFYPKNLTEIHFLWNIGAINAVALSLYLFNSITPLLILYTLMQGIMAWFVFVIAQELFDNKVAYISLLLFVLYPANYGCGTSALSEVPFIFFSLLALYLALKTHFFASGICFAIANYARPMAIIFIVPLLIYMIYKRVSARKYIFLFIGYYIITCTIGISNYITKDKYFTQGAMGWMGLMQYSWDHDSNKEDDYHLFPNNDPNHISEETHYDCLQRDSVWRSHFFIWLSHNKSEYLKQMPKKIVKTYISDNVNFCTFLPNKEKREYMYEEISMPTISKDFPNWTHVQILTVVNLAYYYALLLLGVLGIGKLLKEKHFHSLIIPAMTIITSTALLVFVGHGEARFHQPFMSMFIILSAYFIASTHTNVAYHSIWQKK